MPVAHLLQRVHRDHASQQRPIHVSARALGTSFKTTPRARRTTRGRSFMLPKKEMIKIKTHSLQIFVCTLQMHAQLHTVRYERKLSTLRGKGRKTRAACRQGCSSLFPKLFGGSPPLSKLLWVVIYPAISVIYVMFTFGYPSENFKITGLLLRAKLFMRSTFVHLCLIYMARFDKFYRKHRSRTQNLSAVL